MHTFVTFFALAAALIGAAHGLTLAHNDVECHNRFTGTLSLLGRRPGAHAHIITLSHNAVDSLTTDFQHAGHPDPSDVHFVFAQCKVNGTQAERWNRGVAIVGQLKVFTQGDKFAKSWKSGGCVTAADKPGNLGRRVLSVESCEPSTQSNRLERQWFVANDFRMQTSGLNRNYITFELRGGPNGKLDIPGIDEGQYAKGKAGVSVRKAGKKLLALVDAKDVLR